MKKLFLLISFLAVCVFSTAARADKILILNLKGGFMQPNSNLASILNADGHQASTSTTYPTTLATVAEDPAGGYDQVWVFMNDPTPVIPHPSVALKSTLVSYLNKGGRVYLQSEVSCCNVGAAFAKDMMTTVVKPTTLQSNFDHSIIQTTGGQALINDDLVGPFGGEGLCIATATGAYRETTGVPLANQVVTDSKTPTSIVAVFFPEADLIAGAGRLTVLGDMNFYGPNAGNGSAMPANRYFLPRMFANLLQQRQVASNCPLAQMDVFNVYNTGSVMQTPTVLVNDLENRATATPATTSNMTVTSIGAIVNAANVAATGITFDASTGTFTVQPSVPNGTYRMPYQICSVANPAECVTDFAQIKVQSPAVDAVDDDFSTTPLVEGLGGATAAVFSNDLVNGVAANAQNATLTMEPGWPAGVTLGADGTIVVAANVPAGTYALSYKACMKAPLDTVCDVATAKVLVSALTVAAAADDYSASQINAATGGSLPTVIGNDTVNGAPATPANAIVAPQGSWPAGITMGSDGSVTIAPNTPVGTYTQTYQICAIALPAVCSTANVVLVINAAPVVTPPTPAGAAPVPSLQQWGVMLLSVLLMVGAALIGVRRSRLS